MFCQRCGNQQPDEANFCGNCGALLKNDFQQTNNINEETIVNKTNEINLNETVNTSQNSELSAFSVLSEFNDDIKNSDNQNNSHINPNYKSYKNKGFSSPLGNISLIFGIISILGVLLFLIIDPSDFSYVFYRNFTVIFPVFVICGLILNILAVYKDKKFKRSILSFYLNFTSVVFMFMYFIYFALIKFLI